MFMGDDDHRDPCCIDLLQDIHDLKRRFGIERPGGLIGKDNLRFSDQCPGDSNPLFLTSRHLAGQVMRPFGQSHAVEVFHCDQVAFFPVYVLVI